MSSQERIVKQNTFPGKHTKMVFTTIHVNSTGLCVQRSSIN